MPPVNGVGEPCAGEPHARFDAAGAGNGAPGHGHAAKRPAGETRGKVAAGPHAGQRHRASPRPYPVQRGRPPAITREAARRRLRDSGTLSGTSAEEEQMTGTIMPLRERDTSTVQAAADAFLSSPRYANPNTRRGYTGVPGRLLAGLGASRPLAEVSGEELAGLLEQLWGQCAPATWNRNRGAVAAWLSWCTASPLAAPVRPASAERRREHLNATRAVPRPAIDRRCP